MSDDGPLLDAFNSSTSISRRGASSTSTSNVRPRNRRLISVADDNEDEATVATGNPTSQPSTLSPSAPSLVGPSSIRQGPGSSSAYSSRAASPIPSKHPSRGTSGAASGSSNQESLRGRSKARNGWPDLGGDRKPAGIATDFFESSWSSLQGLASNLLGNENTLPEGKASANGHRRKPSRAESPGFFGGAGRIRPSLPSSWGPSGSKTKQSQPGTKEERQALVQAKKREVLLQANADTFADSRGNFKRRDSGDGFSGSASVMSQNEGNTLVYIHHVQPDDSLTGVSIRYGCQLAVLRKANGFWPSDSVQSRKTIVLPVEACTLKGRPIPSDQIPNHLDGQDGSATDDIPDSNTSVAPNSLPPNGSGNCAETNSEYSRGAGSPSLSAGKGPGQAPPWEHESWVKLDGFSSPVELGRISRRALGFFPRARRKSQGQSVQHNDFHDSPLTRHNSHLSEEQSNPPSLGRDSHEILSIPSSPSQRRGPLISRSNPSPSYRHHRQRSSIVLSGPGGVGTLGRNAIGPGPAPDKLNNFVNSHLPNLSVPPQTNQQQPPSSFIPYQDDRISFESTVSTTFSNSSSTRLENVGGAIEGFFRKAATQAKASLNDIQQQQSPRRKFNSHGLEDDGDLIELDDATFEASRTPTSVPAFSLNRGHYTNGYSREGTFDNSSSSDTWDGTTTRNRSANLIDPERSKDD